MSTSRCPTCSLVNYINLLSFSRFFLEGSPCYLGRETNSYFLPQTPKANVEPDNTLNISAKILVRILFSIYSLLFSFYWRCHPDSAGHCPTINPQGQRIPTASYLPILVPVATNQFFKGFWSHRFKPQLKAYRYRQIRWSVLWVTTRNPLTPLVYFVEPSKDPERGWRRKERSEAIFSSYASTTQNSLTSLNPWIPTGTTSDEKIQAEAKFFPAKRKVLQPASCPRIKIKSTT